MQDSRRGPSGTRKPRKVYNYYAAAKSRGSSEDEQEVRAASEAERRVIVNARKHITTTIDYHDT